MVSVIYSPEFLEHDTGYGHPEKAKRLIAIIDALKRVPWQAQLNWQAPTSAADNHISELIRQFHTPEHIQRIKALSSQGGGYLDQDTPISSRSYEVGLLAVSAWIDGVNRVITGETAFVLSRPPGHHATREKAMGFCLFSNAAIAASYALTLPEINRVGILDWDVHHGNGTEAIVQDNPQIAYCSVHQHPCYPGTGVTAQNHGAYQNILNIPLAAGSKLIDYQLVFEDKIRPFFKSWKPDLLIVSAGYDANQADPLAEIALLPQDYSLLTKYVLEITDSPLFGLEGGYHLETLAQSVVATLQVCLS